MSDNQASETQSIIPSQNGITTPKSLDDLKALFYLYNLSTGQKFNGVEESLGIEMKVKDEVTQEIKTTTK
ncbi:hypothetical protein, partial [Phormidium tenue]